MSADRISVEHAYGRRARQSLEDILDFAQDAAELVARGKKTYDSDRMLHLAAEAITARIGEAVGRLPDALVGDHSEIPFRQAKGMRNFVSHQYDRVSPDVVWNTLASSMPALATQIERLLRG